MKRVWNTYFLACVAAAVMLVLPRTAAAAPIISIDPSAKTVATGDSFSLDVNIADVERLSSYQVSVAFNPATLSATQVDDGTFLDSSLDGFTFYFSTIDNTAGVLNFTGTLLNTLDGVSGAGLIATLHFMALSPGITAVTPQFSLENEIGDVVDGVFDVEFLPIEVALTPGSVEVTGPSTVPEPSIALLVAAGLGSAARWRRRRQA